MWDLVKIAITLAEVFSAIICFVLVWFMMKPYRLTGDARFLGLPLGFGIMGISHVIATAVDFSSGVAWYWVMLIFRTFSFVFLALTYLFSSRASNKTQYLWNITLSAIVVVLFSLSLLVVVRSSTLGKCWQLPNLLESIYGYFSGLHYHCNT